MHPACHEAQIIAKRAVRMTFPRGAYRKSQVQGVSAISPEWYSNTFQLGLAGIGTRGVTDNPDTRTEHARVSHLHGLRSIQCSAIFLLRSMQARDGRRSLRTKLKRKPNCRINA